MSKHRRYNFLWEYGVQEVCSMCGCYIGEYEVDYEQLETDGYWSCKDKEGCADAMRVERIIRKRGIQSFTDIDWDSDF